MWPVIGKRHFLTKSRKWRIWGLGGGIDSESTKEHQGPDGESPSHETTENHQEATRGAIKREHGRATWGPFGGPQSGSTTKTPPGGG